MTAAVVDHDEEVCGSLGEIIVFSIVGLSSHEQCHKFLEYDM
jgi:hypothetical protein